MRGELAFFLCMLPIAGCAELGRAERACLAPTVAAAVQEGEDQLLEALDRGVKPEEAAIAIATRAGWAQVFCIAEHLLSDQAAEVAGPPQARACRHRPVRRSHRALLKRVRALAREHL